MGYGRTNIAGGGLRIKSTQRGIYSMDSYGTWEDIKISQVDLASSIVVITVEQTQFKNDQSWFTVEFRDSTTIRVWRMDNSSYGQTIYWTVYELAGFKSLQYATAAVARSNTNENVTRAYANINYVNREKCLVFTSLRFNAHDDKYASPGGWVRLTSNTQLEVGNADARTISVIGNAFIVELR